MGVLYKLIGPTGKGYIGITLKSARRRFSAHVSNSIHGGRGALDAALRKYGKQSFILSVLTESSDWQELCSLEKLAIVEHGTLAPKGYNLTTGGEGVPGPRNEMTGTHIATSLRRYFSNPANRKRVGDDARRRFSDPAQRQKTRESALVRWMNPLEHIKQSETMQKVFSDPAVRARASAAALKRYADPVKRQKMLNSLTSDARRAASSAALRRRWADPEQRAKFLAHRNPATGRMT